MERSSNRRNRQLLRAVIVVTALSSAVWLRYELRLINEIDVVAVCGTPSELPDEIIVPGKSGQKPWKIYPRSKYCRLCTDEFEECRDRFAGLDLKLPRRKSNRDAARDHGARSFDAQLADLSRRFGQTRARLALQWRYGSPEQIAKYYGFKMYEFVVLIVLVIGSAIPVMAFVLAAIKAINRCSTSAAHRGMREFRPGDN